ncbi:MAG: amidohydrolase family protein [Monoglobaceae bacterium]
METIKKIDIHAHAAAFPEYYPKCNMYGNRFVSAEEVIRFYDELNIEKGILLPISSPEGQISPMTSEACKMLSDKYPDRFMWFCSVDPRAFYNEVSDVSASKLSEILLFYKSLGAKGVGEITSQVYVDDPKMDMLFSCCEECDMPVLFHIGPQFGKCYGMVDELGLPRLEKMIKKHHNLKFIGHSQPFWSEISGDNNNEIRNSIPQGKVIPGGRLIELLREYGNLYCDLSACSGSNAIIRDPDFGAEFIEEFSDRIMYGCDICSVENTMQYSFNDYLNKMLEEKTISEDNYRKMVRDNAIRILSL